MQAQIHPPTQIAPNTTPDSRSTPQSDSKSKAERPQHTDLKSTPNPPQAPNRPQPPMSEPTAIPDRPQSQTCAARTLKNTLIRRRLLPSAPSLWLNLCPRSAPSHKRSTPRGCTATTARIPPTCPGTKMSITQEQALKTPCEWCGTKCKNTPRQCEFGLKGWKAPTPTAARFRLYTRSGPVPITCCRPYTTHMPALCCSPAWLWLTMAQFRTCVGKIGPKSSDFGPL